MSVQITPKEEDCLEAIYNGNNRVKSIAKELGVKAPTVIEMLERMEKKGLVKHKKYGPVELTEAGREIAEQIVRRHNILENFFSEILGLDENISREEACKIEHYLYEESIERLVLFIEFLKENYGKEIFSKFKDSLEE